MIKYLRHEGFGNQVSLFCLFGLIQILVGSSNIHVSTNIICSNKNEKEQWENKILLHLFMCVLTHLLNMTILNTN